VHRFMAFDRHMNLVLGDAEEYRKLPPKKGKSEDEVLPHHSPLPILVPTWRASSHKELTPRQGRSRTAS
jgi:small nuclear ribonucleoprotein (snRNP)-like protein